MEGAWFLSTGQRVSFSSQQILDCAWGFVPGSEGAAMACDGGDPWAGIGHIVDAGGIALTEDYQYKASAGGGADLGPVFACMHVPGRCKGGDCQGGR